MDKRYQIFISSTYTDLKEEREKVMNAIMKMNCIPAGMELFSAIDEEQFTFIKRIIDDSDYYILIIGGRYGSLTEEGLSYTEKEYDYAVEKGLKVIALLHKDPDSIPIGKSEKDPELRQKLSEFRHKIETDKKIVDYWATASELPGLVMAALTQTIRYFPAVGWIRANTVTNPEAFVELNQVRKERERLQNENIQLKKKLQTIDNQAKQSQYDWMADRIRISGHDEFYKNNSVWPTGREEWSYEIPWKTALLILLDLCQTPIEENDLFVNATYSLLAAANHVRQGDRNQCFLDTNSINDIRLQIRVSNFINISNKAVSQFTPFTWYITKDGAKILIQLRKEMET